MPGQLSQYVQAHRKELVAGGAAVTVALALYARHRQKSTGPGQTLGTPTADGSAVLDPVTGLPTATYTGAAQVDTTATDVAGNLDPMLVQQTTLLQQILAGITNPPKVGAPNPAPKPKPKPVPKPKPKPKGPTTGPPAFHRGLRPPPAAPGGRHSTGYTVRRGDSLSKIGAAHHVSWESIYRANRGVIGSNPNVIKPGQKLRIP